MRIANPEALVSVTFRSRTRVGFTVIGLAASAWNALAAYRHSRRIEAELCELDDRMLRDIGLTRTEIPYLARHGRGSRFDLTKP